MRSKTLTFNGPLSPLPDPQAVQLVAGSAEGWRLTVINGSTHRQINTVGRFIKVGLKAARFSDLAVAFQEAGAKSVVFTYSDAIVNEVRWKKGNADITVNLPEGELNRVALRAELGSFAFDSAGELLSELRQLNDNTANLLQLMQKRYRHDCEARGYRDDMADEPLEAERLAGE